MNPEVADPQGRPSADAQRKPRADAQRNVVRLVTAAREAIAEVGMDVSAHEIARRAGVGIGTFYRRVPSRDALLEAVLAELIGETVAVADRAMADPDPWHGFCDVAVALVELRAASIGVTQAMGRECGAAPAARMAELRQRLRSLVERAQAAGVMRTCVAWQDVPFLLASVATGTTTLGLRSGAQQWRRNLQVMLDGLHTQTPTALVDTPPVEA